MNGIRCLVTAGFAVLLPTLATAQFPSLEPRAPSSESGVPSPEPQPPATTPLTVTLEEAIVRGLATSHRLAEAAARGEAADAVAAERHAALLPQIAGQAGYTRTNHVDEFGILLPNNQVKIIYPDVPDNYRARLDLQWPIYTAGRLDALERAARTEAAASADDLAAARADLRLEITRAYWALVTAAESVHVVDESVTRVGAHLRDVRNQLSAGLIAPNEVLSVEAQESRQRMLSIQARATRDVAEAELGRLIGAEPGTAIQPASALDAPGPESATTATLIATARRQRAEGAALAKRVKAADQRKAAAAAGRKPTIAIGGGLDYARPNPRIFPREAAWRESWDASINVNWPLADGGRTRAEVAEATAMARAAGERLAEFDAAVAVEIRQRLSELESSRAAIEAATDAVRAAAEASRVVGDRFNAGVATSTDRLDAHVALIQADLDRTQALANARLAQARLARALGQ
jgi:outer membrane protein TolC